MKKKIFALLIALLFVILNFGCDLYPPERTELSNKFIDRFSSFNHKTDIAKIEYCQRASFYGHSLDIVDLHYKGRLVGILCSFSGKLYFYTTEYKTDVKNDGLLRIYKCDYNGENLTEVFCENLSRQACYYSDHTKGIIYVERQDHMFGDYYLDYYEIETGKCENIGKVSYYSYIGRDMHERWSVMYNKLREDIALVEEMLSASEEGRAFLEYKPNLKNPRVAFLNGCTFVSYTADVGRPGDHLDVTFEYDETQNELRYYCYNFLSASEGIRDIYLY